ncbi:hypothetical protein SVAN01_04995 [Stagonosporopsis vannaccii]|nr:hypothetical protein SVAN01_04995 [Stagonosporopsis vannaccii]
MVVLSHNKSKSDLRRHKGELKKEKNRYRSLEGIKKVLQSQNRQMKTEITNLKTQLFLLRKVEDDFCTSLQDQAHALQKQLPNNVKKAHVVFDDLFANDFRKLATMVRSLSRSVRFTQDTSIFEALGGKGSLPSVQKHHLDTGAQKKCLTEAWIWSTLLGMVFQTPFTILGNKAAAAANLWKELFERTVQIDGETLDEVESEEGRMRATTTNDIGTWLANLPSAVNFTLVRRIVEAAFALALKMSFQKSRLPVTFPSKAIVSVVRGWRPV